MVYPENRFALFVVLDPFWYTKSGSNRGDGNWRWTLGKQQYDWLKHVLQTSKSRFKFVFSHHLVGGQNSNGNARGGIEAAPYFEWGGRNADGSWGFDQKRPGWGKPIHQLMVDSGVTAFFHGHDHFFDKQDLSGIVYQLVPQPGNRGYDRVRQASEYGYVHGVIMPPAGYLRVTVAPSKVKVDYVRSYLAADENEKRHNGEVAYSYTVPAGENRRDFADPGARHLLKPGTEVPFGYRGDITSPSRE